MKNNQLIIAGKKDEGIKNFSEKISSAHRINCLSKTFAFMKQRDCDFDYIKKKLKRIICNLSIMNQKQKNIELLGHFIKYLNKFIKHDWDKGFKILIASTTSKVIFISINKLQDFINCIDLLRQELIISEGSYSRPGRKLKEYLFSRPYFIFVIFLEIADFTDKLDKDFLQSCLQKLFQDDIQFKQKDIKQLFVQIDTNVLEQFRDRVLLRFENRDTEIECHQRTLPRLFEIDNTVDSKDHLDIIEEQDLFAFSSITANSQWTNYQLYD